jgi:hypothetical protein
VTVTAQAAAASAHVRSPLASSAGKGGCRPVFAVDLDETVFNTVLVWMELLSDQFGGHGGLTPRELVCAYRHTNEVPAWKGREDVEAFMVRARRDHDIHVKLPLIEGAVEGLQALASWADLVYLTMRPEEVREATQQAIILNQLPDGQVIMPDIGMPLADRPRWKGTLLHEMYPSLVGIVDDSPDVVQKIPDGYQGTVLLFGHDQPLRSDIQVIPCPTWRDVLAAFQREIPRHIPRGPHA